jgi:hypothetical protein
VPADCRPLVPGRGLPGSRVFHASLTAGRQRHSPVAGRLLAAEEITSTGRSSLPAECRPLVPGRRLPRVAYGLCIVARRRHSPLAGSWPAPVGRGRQRLAVERSSCPLNVAHSCRAAGCGESRIGHASLTAGRRLPASLAGCWPSAVGRGRRRLVVGRSSCPLNVAYSYRIAGCGESPIAIHPRPAAVRR